MNALVFGATGSIGGYIFDKFTNTYENVIGTTSNKNLVIDKNIVHVDNSDCSKLQSIDMLDAVVWAQGFNLNDNIELFDYENYTKVMEINVSFILNTLKYLVSNDKLRNGAKLVIISSIWEDLTKENKLSYSISKNALSGVVKSIAYDLASKNILVNNVLPGIIDNEMTRKALTPMQLDNVQTRMKFGRLTSLDDVYNTVNFLLRGNTGITGQSIKVDLGFTNIVYV